MIPDNQMFAGRNVGSMPAQLAVCQSCLLGFRSPQPSKSELADLYESGSETAWSEGSEVIRKDWELAAQWVERIGASRVLDIGCFDGGFLEMLPATILKAGVEINPAASQRAAERGVQLVASDFHDLDVVAETFDLVSAFDVIEHVHNPKAFLETLSAVVRPGGYVLFATGNLDSPTWRVLRSRYLYSWYLEHIAFVSPRWVNRHAQSLGFEVAAIDRFSHTSDKQFGFLIGLLKNCAYRISPRLANAVRVMSRHSSLEEPPTLSAGPPAWTSARDHILVVLRKKK